MKVLDIQKRCITENTFTPMMELKLWVSLSDVELLGKEFAESLEKYIEEKDLP